MHLSLLLLSLGDTHNVKIDRLFLNQTTCLLYIILSGILIFTLKQEFRSFSWTSSSSYISLLCIPNESLPVRFPICGLPFFCPLIISCPFVLDFIVYLLLLDMKIRPLKFNRFLLFNLFTLRGAYQ